MYVVEYDDILSERQIGWIQKNVMSMVEIASQYEQKPYISDDDWRTIIAQYLKVAQNARNNFMIISVSVSLQNYLGKMDALPAAAKMNSECVQGILQYGFQRMIQGDCSAENILKDIHKSGTNGYVEQELLKLFDGYNKYYIQITEKQRRKQR